MLVCYPNDWVERAQGADALRSAEELLLVGKPELEFGNGNAAFGRCIGRSKIKLLAVVFVTRVEVEISLEMVGETG